MKVETLNIFTLWYRLCNDVMDREFEMGASIVLDQLCEKDQDKSYELLTQERPAWREQNLFSLAEDVGQGDFVNNKCCQTKLDKIWFGKTKPSTSVFTVGMVTILSYFWPTVLSVEPLVQCVVCRLSVCLSSVTFCIVAKRYVLAKKCLKE